MSHRPPKPILYLITSGKTRESTTSQTEEYRRVLHVIETAVTAGIDLVQIREKKLPDRELYALTTAAVSLAQGSSTRIFVNDRADIAAAAGAHGVHLTSHSLRPNGIKRVFGEAFLVGASTHSIAELLLAKDEGSDFAVFGPVFRPKSKSAYGPPQGVEKLREAATSVQPFPVLALGGIDLENARECYRAGASGIAAISLFEDSDQLTSVVPDLLNSFSSET